MAAAAAAALRGRAYPLMASVPSFLTWRRLGFRSFCSGQLGFLSQPPEAESTAAAGPVPGLKILETFREEFEIGSRTISIETGKVARFANGSVVITMDETNVLSTVASARGDGARDFLPLTVDYQEKQYAQGVIPTTFMRREGAPKERELLCGRLIDRPIRPLFPPGFYHDVQVMVNVLSSDGKHDPDVMAANATSAALMLSNIPWNGPIGVIRVGRIDGKFVFNPTMDELSLSDLNLVYACTRDRTLMIDVQAREISEKDLQAGLKLAHPEAVKYIEPQIRLAEKAGKKKKEYKLSMISDRTLEKIQSLAEAPIEAVFTDSTYGKFERGEALDKITQAVKAKLEEESDEESLNVLPKAIDMVRKKIIRHRIIKEGVRVDGRQLDEVRPLYCESGTYPILHGSSLFSRGDTQSFDTSFYDNASLIIMTAQYLFFSTLAEKALLAVLPPEDDFPYTVRVNSEVMASDGSTSMATVCGGSMALMDAGIPVREHVAGVSVGLVTEVDPSTGMINDYRILTDILGLEDHLGDMDFKIAGTRKGITAIQLDIKPAGIPVDIICECLEPAQKGRNHILDRMEREICSPRTMGDGSTPRLATLKFSNDLIQRLLGPLGSQRKKIEQETGARIAVSDGTVTIVAKNRSVMEKAKEKVDFVIGREIEVGGIYKGVISSIKEYGAFVEFNGGQQGLLHISELSHEPVSRVSDVVSVGQDLSVMCIGQDVRGNIKLSLKAVLPWAGSEKKNLESQDSVPPKQEVNVWASMENTPICQEDEDGEVEPATNSTPAVVIRSAAECNAQDIAAGQYSIKKSGKGTKTSPRPYNASSGHRDNFRSILTKRKPISSPNQTQMKKENELKDLCGSKPETDSRPENLLHALMQNEAYVKPKSFGSTSVFAGSVKLGDRVTAKVNGRRDFEVGKELHVQCSSFSSKGIPVFSLLEDE
ncbi:Polyribonucleotide nucleotidyltransferase 2, mitochondrial [Cocos nucifera]|uniref:polyribonucleotide nucleotidyltransferase n=1 Tax=Cocos nucifera TaxID=13894 RepID=A0A8K0ISS8_COCNU|nr:Polyribonucleotide nucleotidyltransferase 2, mitochondrial [Cocos nucifera]